MYEKVTLLPTRVVVSILNPDQACHNIRPDLDPNCLTLIVFLKEFFKKLDFEKYQQMTICIKNYTVGRAKVLSCQPKVTVTKYFVYNC